MATFELALVIAALLGWGRVLGPAGPPRSLFRIALETLAIHTAVSVLASVALWSLGGFRVVTAQALAAALPLALVLRQRLAPWPGLRGAPLMTRHELIALLLLVLVSPVALPRMQLLYMENDAGVYSNRAIHHLHHDSMVGTIPVRERLAGSLLEVFDQDNLQRARFLPGTYPTRRGGSEFLFQFYPGWPLLMAQCGGVLGLPRTFHAVLLSFALAALLFAALLEDRGPDLTAYVATVALFSSSPLLLYFSRYTTAEALLLFLFLFVLYFFSFGGAIGCALGLAGLAALVVSHISTFLYAPLVLLLCLEGYRSANRRTALFAAGAFAILLGGLGLGHYFSPDYFVDIFRASFGRLFASNPARWGLALVTTFYGLGLGLSLVAVRRAGRAATPRDGTAGWPDHGQKVLTGLVRAFLLVVLAYTVFQAYRLGWTDHFVPEQPIGSAWRERSTYAATGWRALAHANIVSMLMASSLVGLPFVLGLALTTRGGKAFGLPHRRFLLAAVLLSLAIYTFTRFDTPINYYASRYFIPVFLPAVMLLFGELIGEPGRRRRWVPALALLGLAFNLTFDRALYAYKSYTDELRFVEDVAGRVGDNRVLFVRNHRRDSRLAQRLLALPLADAHNISLVNVVNRTRRPVDQIIDDYGRHLQLRDAAVLARQPPSDGRSFEVVELMQWYLRPALFYPLRPGSRRVRFYLYNVVFKQ